MLNSFQHLLRFRIKFGMTTYLAVRNDENKKVEDKFKLIFESAPDATVIVNKEGKIQLVNIQTEKLFGYTRGELIGKGIELLMPSRYKSAHQAHVKGFSEKHKVRAMGAVGAELFAQHKDGKEFPVEINLSPLELAEGFLTSVAIRDVTKQKQAEENLREKDAELLENTELFKTITYNTQNLVLLRDTNELVVFTNLQCKNVLGFSCETYVGKELLLPVHPLDKEEYKQKWDALKTKGKNILHYEFRIIDPSGNIRWLSKSTTPMLINGKVKYYQTSIRNITDKKEAEQKLIQSENQVRNFAARLNHSLEDERRRIAREIHDELGQQLTAFKMGVDWVLRKQKDPEGEVVKKLNELIKMSDAAVTSIRRISADLRPAIIDDLGLVAALEGLCSNFKNKSGIACQFISSVKERKFEDTFSINIYRIAQETLTNVVRHAQAKLVTVSFSESNTAFILEITDDGKGISTQNIQNDKSLGITGMKERAALLGGELIIEGTKNKGTCTTLVLPLKN